MKQDPTYFRARLAVIEDLYKSLDTNRDQKNPERTILRNGVFPERFSEKELVLKKLAESNIPGHALSFEEITRFNNWFAMQPEKVAGKEVITSSREFPISIVGTKEDILKTIQVKSKKSKVKSDFQFQLELKRKTAKSKLKLLQI